MYKISTRGQYALLIMTELAEQPDGKFISLKLLSHRHNLSVKYLEQILIQLSKAGLVNGVRGSNGGYKLVKKTEEYTTGEILRALEGDLSPIGESNNNVITPTAGTTWSIAKTMFLAQLTYWGRMSIISLTQKEAWLIQDIQHMPWEMTTMDILYMIINLMA